MNNREIKFRCFFKGQFWHFVIGQSMTNFQEAVYNECCLHGVQFQQFTGLKDKNGNEIYEGDIMCWPKYEGTKNQSRWVVEWDNDKGEYTKWHPRMEAERIGNLYDNPDLLKP